MSDLKTYIRSYSDFSGIQIARNTTECEHLEIPKYPSTIAGFLNEKRFHIPFDDVTDLINIEQSCTVRDPWTYYQSGPPGRQFFSPVRVSGSLKKHLYSRT